MIAAAEQGVADDQQMMRSFFRDSLVGLPEMGVCARQLWETSGLGPDDIQTAVIYDHFTPFVLPQLEEFGFCARGEAKDFLRDGNVELGGSLPINTHGGQLSAGRLHGYGFLHEGATQMWGEAGERQIATPPEVGVIGAGGGNTCGCLLLVRE